MFAFHGCFKCVIYNPTCARTHWTLNVTEPVAGNYVPCGSVATLTGDPDAALHVLPDRSQGVASINDGELEAMVGGGAG